MTRIETEKVEVNYSQEKIFSFLSDFNNFQKLMPPQVVNWQSTENDCSFTIAGMGTIGMKIIEKKPHSEIKIVSNGKVPFNFTLNVLTESAGENKSVGQLIFEAELPAMIKMMVEKPLGNFFNLLTAKMKDINLG